MKKLFLLMGMAAAMINFAGCQKNEIEDPNANLDGSTFELVAEIAQTKTTLDPSTYAVDWVAGDVIYMVTSDGTWGAPYVDDTDATTIAEFTYADGKFATTSTIADDTYTFKAMYARADQKSYHRGTSTTHKLEAVQDQDCSDPTAHVKLNDALIGTFEAATPMTVPAEITMSHIYTLMQVDIKNGTDADIEVAKFEMTAAGADLAGVFNVESFETPSISIKSAASSTITVNVTNGTVEAGQSLPVYFVMAPLSNYSGDVTFKVTDAEGKTYTKTVTLNGISFEAGKYNTTPYTISTADEVEPLPEGVNEVTISFATTEQRTNYSTSEQVWENSGVTFTNAKGSSTSNVADYSNPARFYKNSTITVEAPGNIAQIVFICNTADYATSLKNSIGESATVSEKTVTVSIDGETSFTCTLSDGQVRMDELTVTYEELDPTAPSITAGNVTGVSARGDEAAELTYEIANLEYSDLTVTCDGTVVTSASKGEDGVINYEVSVNSTTSARDGSITISNGTLTKEVKVSQLASVFTVSRNTVELGATKDSKTTVTVTSDFDWELGTEGSGYSANPLSYTWAEDGKATVTIIATSDRTEEGVVELGTITITNKTTNEELRVVVTQTTSFVAEDGETITESLTISGTTGVKTSDGGSISWTGNNFTCTNLKGSTAIRTSDSDHYRVYVGSTLKFSANAGKTFNKLVLTCVSSYVANTTNVTYPDNLSVTVDGTTVTITCNEAVSEISLPIVKQIRIKKVEATLQ